MPLVLKDRVQETATANATDSFTLTGAVLGFQSFLEIGNGSDTYYSAFDFNGNWEVGLGNYTTAGPTLTRTTIYSSSNSNAAVTFPGTVNVFITYPSEKSVYQEADGIVAINTASFADGSAASPSITNTGDTNTGIFFPADNTTAFSANGVEAMRIGSTGTVGIGTAAAASRLTVGGDTRLAGDLLVDNNSQVGISSNISLYNFQPGRNTAVQIFNELESGFISFNGDEFGIFNNSNYMYMDVSSSLLFGTDGTERMRITPTGLVNISGLTASQPVFTDASNNLVSIATIPIANGGTNSSDTPTAGGIAYGTGTAYAITPAGTNGQVLTSTGSGVPTWTTPASSGVTSVSVVSANGLAGTVATATTTPAITLSTTITGVLKGDGTSISAAVSGVDFAPPTSTTNILKGAAGGGFAAAISGQDYCPATSGSSILYGNGAGGLNNVTIGTGLSFTTGTLSATNAGTVTSVGGTGTVSGISLSGTVTSSGNLTLGGTLDLSSPPAIGSTTANTGSFTTGAFSSVASFAAGSVSAPSITRTGDTNTGIFFPAADTIAFTEGGVEAMRITSDGNLGIGLTPAFNNRLAISSIYGPDYGGNQLAVYGQFVDPDGPASAGITLVADNTTLNFFASDSSSLTGLMNPGLRDMTFGTNNIERMRITSAGVVNITGLTASQAVLTDASKNLVSVATTGSGNIVRATRPTMSVTGAGFTLQDATDNTKQANFVLSSIPIATTYSYTLPNVTGTLAALNLAQTFTATQTFSGVTVSLGGVTTLGGAVTMNTTAGAISIGSGQTTGTLALGNTAQTGTITLGQSTVSQTTNIQAGATASGSTKTVNISTGGLAGSTTNTTIGSTAGTSTTTINSLLVQQTYTVANLPTGVAGARSFVTNALSPTFGSAVTGGGSVGVPVYHDGTSWKVG